MNIERNELIRIEHSPTHVSMKFAISFCTALILFQSGCKDNPVDAPIKNPREYTWTVEKISTSDNDQTFMSDMYAVDSKNIWIVGHNSNALGKMYHYDGSGWTRQNLNFGVTFDLEAVTGFGKDNIWAVGMKWPQASPQLGFIIHYNGSQWLEVNGPEMNRLECVWGSGPSDVWFGGLDGTLLKYDGLSIKPDSVPRYIPKNANPNWGFYAGASGSGEEQFTSLAGQPLPAHVTWSYTFRRQSSHWTLVDSSYGLINRLWYSPWGKLYQTGGGVGYWTTTGWKFLSLNAFTRGVYGVAEDNLFAVGTIIWHWNGTDWFEFKNVSTIRMTYYKVWTDGREVFIIGVGNDDNNTYILHGK